MKVLFRTLAGLFCLTAPAYPQAPHIPQPPAEHPRLYLRARDLPDLRRRLTDPVTAPDWQQLQAMAKQKTQIRLEVDALRYLLDHDDALGRRTVDQTIAFLGKLKLDRYSDSRKPGRLMDTAAMVYDWCYPVITAQQKTLIRGYIIRLARTLECGYPPDRGSFVVGHPSEFMILRDMLSAGIAIYDEDPEMYRLAAGRILGSHVPARDWWYPGGAFHQGPGYADARFASDMYAAWIFARMGAAPIFDASQRNVPYQWIYLRRPDNFFLRSGDGQNWPTQMGSLLAASFYHDGYVLSDWLKDPVIDPTDKLFDFLWPEPGTQPMAAVDSKIFEFLWRDPDLKPQPLSDLPYSRYYGGPYGWMTARTGWDQNSVIAEMKVNVYNFSNHQHADAGSFELYYHGPLAIHSGVYQGVNGGYGSAHWRNYYTRTIAHNSLLILDPDEKFGSGGGRPLVNDGGQRLLLRSPVSLDDLLKGNYKTGEVLAHGFGPDPDRPAYTYLKGDITAAYSSKVRKVERSQVFLNLGPGAVPAAFVVFDRVVASNPDFKKYWLLQSPVEPSIDGQSQVVSLGPDGPKDRPWSGKLWNTTLLPPPDNLNVEKVGGPGKEFWVFGKNFPDARNPPDPEMGGWRVQLSPKQPSAADLFLNVMQVMDRSVAKPLPVERVETGGPAIIGLQIANRVVIFNGAQDRGKDPVSFKSVGPGGLEYLITDLAEGAWKLSWNGHAIRSLQVGEDGTAYFAGPSGPFTLTHP